jgi:hypothetical protein
MSVQYPRRLSLMVALLVLAACDVPIGTPPHDGKGKPMPPTQEESQVQVIVRLRFAPPADAAPDSAAYKSALTATREKFLREIDVVPHRVVRTYDTLPLVVLTIAPSARATLEQSALVASVEDDRLNAPVAH